MRKITQFEQGAAFVGSAFIGFAVQKLAVSTSASGGLEIFNIAMLVLAFACGAFLLPNKLRGLDLNQTIFLLFHLFAGWSFGSIWAIKIN